MLGFHTHDVIDGLALYTGARRRFEFKGEAGQVRVYDDYAHHHTELRATLTAARQLVGDRRLVVAFQPLRYSRTAIFFRELGEALLLRLLLTPLCIILEFNRHKLTEKPFPFCNPYL